MNKMSDRVSYLILFIPWFFIFFAFTFGLALFNVFISFTGWHGIFPKFNIVGFKNYIELPAMAGFVETLKNVGMLFGLGLPFAVFISTLLATLIDMSGRRVAAVFRSIAVVSMALGGVVVALFWSWMFDFRYGGINTLFRTLGLGFMAVDWIGKPQIVMFSVTMMLVWKFCGYGALVILGGLQGIPETHLEAARLDGATTWQIYLRILLPQVRGHILTIALLLSMFLLKSFDYIYALTGGGPGWSSTLFPILVYRKMFDDNNFAGGAAAATFMFLIVAVIAIPYLVLSRREGGAKR
jgi:glucose/mannose transport system permease protein